MNFQRLKEFAESKSKHYHMDLPIATVLDNPKKEWNLITGKSAIRNAKVNIDWKVFNSNDFIFSHATALCSVNVEDNGYYIKPDCNELVNTNGNSWSSQILLATYKTFVGGFNFVEHLQIESLSKGTILDAVIRPVKHKSEIVYYVDLLIATEKKHIDLVSKIISGEIKTLSMGCSSPYCTCSKCGKVISEGEDNCEHIENELLTTFKDKNGVTRIVSEMCGRLIKENGKLVADKNSVEFFEISWVENPAFKGAVVNHFIEFPNDKKVASNDLSILYLNNYNLNTLRVADTYGMISLKVAKEEMKRQSLLSIVDNVKNKILRRK